MSSIAGDNTPVPSGMPRGKRPAPPPLKTKSSMSWDMRPRHTLTSLLRMQTQEDSKPRVSKISWLDDVMVYSSSILPVVLRPVIFFTAWSAVVAVASIVYGKDLALTNNVVPLLSVVVGLLLVFRNSSAYERYAEGRKDFTALISCARNLSRAVWINVVPPPDRPLSRLERHQLTHKKKEIIRLILGFVFATKHYLRSEGGAEHADLQGLLPKSLARFVWEGPTDECEEVLDDDAPSTSCTPPVLSPRSYSTTALQERGDEERVVGLSLAPPSSPTRVKSNSFSFPPPSPVEVRPNRPRPVRRPTAVRVRPTITEKTSTSSSGNSSANERTPLIKSGVRSDLRRTHQDVETQTSSLKTAHRDKLGRMVEVGLPLVIAHEISRSLFRFRRNGNLESIGPAGFNSMSTSVQNMVDQLGSMERIQTPLPYVFTSHLKQCVTIYLLCLPFVLVDVLGWKTIFIVATTAFTLCGVEGIAAQVEMPFGTDPSDLNLDLFCTELLCECEAVLERLPEGDEDDEITFVRSPTQIVQDELDGE
ncbi:UPF0187-domain-containing protein [Cutaneotrichosporon oleaginosum]|uniref:UPF0187-domain-containing protein n=1 Tax=Cutaneotrichosporon oleaginosum TaxID=879819 RepID=A0A0J1B9G6_9TREE|nr:UPF0187-domain-containing protein [Cutaneotrichosporon oleaginosum]KLT44479.1 UPF0187-domain-containing protein [Cutaneotrichosporon oleaginosum]TXT14002.1 hypothetical protein COLE_00195 [Cutaneotrichosporon oleaginosum]